MAITTLTIGANTYDVYNSVAEGDVYFAARLGASAWTGATTDEKGQALVMATRLLDRQAWQGDLTDAATPQALAFPRDDIPDCKGVSYADGTTPGPVLDAHLEISLELLADAAFFESLDSGREEKRLKAGSVEVEYFGRTSGKASKFPPHVDELIGCFLSSDAAVLVGNAYGTSNESTSDDDYDVSESW